MEILLAIIAGFGLLILVTLNMINRNIIEFKDEICKTNEETQSISDK